MPHRTGRGLIVPRRGSQAQRGAHHHVEHDPDGPATLTATLVHALADAMDRDPTLVEALLRKQLCLDALDHLFAPPPPAGAPGHLAFAVQDYRVTVYEDGQIVITPPAATPGRRGGGW